MIDFFTFLICHSANHTFPLLYLVVVSFHGSCKLNHQGYYQPAGPLISSHPPPGSQSPLKPKADLLGTANTTEPPPPQSSVQGGHLPPAPPSAVHQIHQPTPSVGLPDHHRLDAGDHPAGAQQAFRYIPQPAGPYARPPIHPIHCTYPPPPPPTYYAAYGQHPQVRNRLYLN